jgi:hypothetical protein
MFVRLPAQVAFIGPPPLNEADEKLLHAWHAVLPWHAMQSSKQVAVRLSDADDALLAALHERLGIQSAADIFRLALRYLAKKEGVEPAPAKPAKGAKGR